VAKAFSNSSPEWVINSYALAFAGLLLDHALLPSRMLRSSTWKTMAAGQRCARIPEAAVRRGHRTRGHRT
jgi:hypothetical protein